MSDDEVFSDASEPHSDEETEEAAGEAGKETKKKPIHPPYEKMLIEAIREQQTSNRQTGISRAKIVEYIKNKYKFEVNPTALKKAVMSAEKNEIIENKTGTGMSGSYIFTKKERALQAKNASKPVVEKTSAKSEGKPPKRAKDDIDLKDTKKKLQPVRPKGKENVPVKETKKKADPLPKKATSTSKLTTKTSTSKLATKTSTSKLATKTSTSKLTTKTSTSKLPQKGKTATDAKKAKLK